MGWTRCSPEVRSNHNHSVIMNLGHQILCHLKLGFPGSQPCLTAFWLPSSLPERKESQLWSQLLPLKLQCYSKETTLRCSSLPRLGPCTTQFQSLILFVEWGVTREKYILLNTAKNKMGLSKVKWCKLGTICTKYAERSVRSCWTESFDNLYEGFHLEMRIRDRI